MLVDVIGHFVQKFIDRQQASRPSPMKITIIVGLGNPGKKYANTRHNLGQMALDKLVSSTPGTSDWKEHNKAPLMYSELVQDGQKIIFAKPLSYMNDSGKPIRKLMDFYKATPDDLIIAHDELDLPVGEIRITPEASSGGHNGLKSIFQHLGTQRIRRVRLGIKNKKLEKIPTDKFVLQPFGLLERRSVEKQLERMAEAIECLYEKEIESCMNQFN